MTPWRAPLDAELAQRSLYWRAALAGEKPPIHDIPEPGFYKRKLVKGGPFVALRIWVEQEIDEAGELVSALTYRAEADGNPANIDHHWPYCADEPISEADYRYMTDTARWAQAHAPNEPEASPRKAIDWLTMAPPDFPKTKGIKK